MHTNLLTLLAQAVQKGAETAPPVGPDGAPLTPAPQTTPEEIYGHLPLNEIWNFIEKLTWMQSILILASGIIIIMYGWRLYKALVVMNCALAGLFFGIRSAAGVTALPNASIWLGVFGVLVFGITAYYMTKYAVSILGAIAGAILGGAIWRTATMPDELIWVGALSGLIAGAFMAFSSFKISIMMFSCLQGAAAVAAAVLGLINDYPNMSSHLAQAFYQYNFFLPLCILVPTFVGFVCQKKMLQVESKWALPEK